MVWYNVKKNITFNWNCKEHVGKKNVLTQIGIWPVCLGYSRQMEPWDLEWQVIMILFYISSEQWHLQVHSALCDNAVALVQYLL